LAELTKFTDLSCVIIHDTVSQKKKRSFELFAITSSTVNQFRKFFHCWILRILLLLVV